MRTIYESSARAVELVTDANIRPQMEWLKQPERLIGINGSRGVGKTTLLLQYAKTILKGEHYVYISLDNIHFSDTKLVDFADDFSKNGGGYLLVDEVHHYPEWSQEIKNIYDNHPDLKVIYTGSSLLQLTKGRADLSRRGVLHTLPGLSLREYVNFSAKQAFPAVGLNDILKNHEEIAKSIWTKVKPIKWFNEYLELGYYPFLFEGKATYLTKLNEVILHVLETDLPITAGISYTHVNKLKQLLYVISESVPFKPNIEKLSERIGISKNTLKDYLQYMNDALLINLLYTDKKGISRLAKPEKIYLHHPNLMYALAPESVDLGNIRETFFYNQLSIKHKVNYTQNGDFIVDDRYVFEIGGKNKTRKQIAGIKDAYLAVDGVETGYKNEIPIWLFGFLY